MSANQFFVGPFGAGIEQVRRSWGWFLVLGIALMLAGGICIVGDVTATFASVLFFGWLLMLSGVFALVHAFQVRTWSGFFLYLASALLRGFTGYLLIKYPAAGAVGMTMVLASFFIVAGLFRAIASATLKFPSWGWSVFSGLVSLALGVMLLVQMPVSSLWFIGFAIGVELVVDGSSLVFFAMALNSLPRLIAAKAA